MAFVSFPFIILIAVTALIYFLVPKRCQWCVLLAASYVYFWINSEWLIGWLLLTTAITFFTGKAIAAINEKAKTYLAENGESMSAKERKACKEKTKGKTKWVMLTGVFLVLGILICLKYFNFFAGNANLLLTKLGVQIPTMRFLLPLGISFYTLQALAYMIDIYRNKYEPDRHFGKFMLFMSYFPQIVQGPIARYNQLAKQFYEEHSFDYKRVMYGAQLIVWGFMKKMIIADRIAIPVKEIFDNYTQYQGLMIFLGAAFYGLQVYADFSGGMDIARGVSQIFGIELELNFKQPYFSKSVEDFWRRWHITLGGWMRDYIFYPLSLSKSFGKLSKKCKKVVGDFVGKRIPPFLAMFIVYFLVGFWHGANWTYIAYGVWNGVFIVLGILLEEVYKKTREKCGIREETFTWRLFQMVRTFVVISMGRLFSNAGSLDASLDMFRRMFQKYNIVAAFANDNAEVLGLDRNGWLILAVFAVILLLVDNWHEKGIQIRQRIAAQHVVFRWIIYYGAILAIIIFGMYGPGYDSAGFIYAQF